MSTFADRPVPFVLQVCDAVDDNRTHTCLALLSGDAHDRWLRIYQSQGVGAVAAEASDVFTLKLNTVQFEAFFE